MPKSEKGHNSVKYLWNFPNFNQVIYSLDTICVGNIMILGSLGGSPDILLTRFHRFTLHKSKKGHNSVKFLQNFVKSSSGHLHLRHNLWAKYYDPSSSGSPDILLTRFHRFTMHKSEKGDKSAKYYRILTKVNQVIYTLDKSVFKISWP